MILHIKVTRTIYWLLAIGLLEAAMSHNVWNYSAVLALVVAFPLKADFAGLTDANLKDLKSVADVGVFAAKLVFGTDFSRKCNSIQELQSTECAILGFLSGADVGKMLFEKKVFAALDEINAKLDEVKIKLDQIGTQVQQILSQLGAMELSLSEQIGLSEPRKIISDFDERLDAFLSLQKDSKVSPQQYRAWALSTMGKSEELRKKMFNFVNLLSAGDKSPFSIFANRILTKYKAFTPTRVPHIRDQNDSLLGYYNGFQSYTLDWILSLQKMAYIYSLASEIIRTNCISEPLICKNSAECKDKDSEKCRAAKRDCEDSAKSCKITGSIMSTAQLQSFLRDQKKLILDELNRQLEGIVLKLGAHNFNSNDPDFTKSSNEKANAVEVMFAHADYFTSAMLNEWGLRGRVISAGNKFSGALSISGGQTLTPVVLGKSRTAADPVQGLGITDYWYSSAKNDAYDTVYFGNWVVYHYFHSFGQAKSSSVQLTTKLPVGQGNIPLNYDPRFGSFGSFFGIERVGGSFAMLSGTWNKDFVPPPGLTSFGAEVQGNFQLGKDKRMPVSKEIATVPKELKAGIESAGTVRGMTANYEPNWVTFTTATKLVNNKVIKMPDSNEDIVLVAEYQIHLLQVGGYFFQTDFDDVTKNKAKVSAGLGIFFGKFPWDQYAIEINQIPNRNDTIQAQSDGIDPNHPQRRMMATLLEPGKYEYTRSISKANLQSGPLRFEAYNYVSLWPGVQKGFSRESWYMPRFSASAAGQLLKLYFKKFVSK